MSEFFIIAGEASGDYYGAKLIERLQNYGDCQISGIGGVEMAKKGQSQIADLTDFAVMGLSEGFSALYRIKQLFDRCLSYIKRHDINTVILIDFPGFNLRLAKELRHTRVIYYISPKVWARNAYRVRLLKRHCQFIMAIFPFEPKWFKRYAMPCYYTGNPLFEELSQVETQKSELGISGPLVMLMPGSRSAEIKMILPTLLETARLISTAIADVTFALPVASTIGRHKIEKVIDAVFSDHKRPHIQIIETARYTWMKAADAAIIASGTATLEAAFLGLPMAVVYRLNPITYRLARLTVKLKWISLPNIIANSAIVPEFIQEEARAHVIAKYVLQLLQDQESNDHVRQQLTEAMQCFRNKHCYDVGTLVFEGDR